MDRKGIQVSGIFSGQREQTDKVTIPAKNGFQWQLSVGANPTAMRFLEHGEEGTVNGQPLKGPLAISAETRLEEVSFVALGADQGTHVVVAAKRKEQLVMASTATREQIACDELRRVRALKRICAAAGHPSIDFRHPSGRISREPLDVAALRCGWPASDVQDIIGHAGRLTAGAFLGVFWDIT